MEQYQVINSGEERAFLVGADVRSGRPLLSLEDSLRELSLLAATAGMVVVGQTMQHMQRIDPNTFIGSGKVEEVREALSEVDARVVIFDDELSPRHLRELEKALGEEVRVLDRSALILDIFAQHARTREGALQVELAQYEYRLPRLTRQWTHLARQAGGGAARGGAAGVGLRGPGETQLEVDRRDIRRRIAKLKGELQGVRQHRSQHRQQRSRAGVPVVALVGYTNAGKSTLLHALTGADVYIADQLFATLDPLSRRVDMPNGRHVVVTDTVGFIQKLPTTLIAAFRATLEEITEASVLLHVVDTSHPNVLQQIETVEDTLAEIDVPPVPRILVWNKIDLWGDRPLPVYSGAAAYWAEVAVSAREAVGIPALLSILETTLDSYAVPMKLLLPYQRGDLISALHESATIESQQHTEDGVLMTVQLPLSLAERFKQYRV
ncbi:MAG: GTPase HflX [Chloroflexi bacterium]|nr:GTPase HflX [Chloroflexota bacterium]MDL1882780.1 GTPase HflX [Anaerolineae bacterium CFX8]